MRPGELNRHDAVDRIADHLLRHDAAGITVSHLADATGIARSSLYHHFPDGQQEMLAAACRRTGRRLHDQALEALEKAELHEAFAAWAVSLSRLYHRGARGCLLSELALRPQQDDPTDRLPEALRRAFVLWTHPVAQLLEEYSFPRATAARLAEDAVGRVLGALIVSRALQTEEPLQRTLESLLHDLLLPYEE